MRTSPSLSRITASFHPHAASLCMSYLPLAVIEVGRHGDNSLLDLLVSSQVGLGSLLHLDEHHGGNLFSLEHLLLTLVSHCAAMDCMTLQ